MPHGLAADDALGKGHLPAIRSSPDLARHAAPLGRRHHGSGKSVAINAMILSLS